MSDKGTVKSQRCIACVKRIKRSRFVRNMQKIIGFILLFLNAQVSTAQQQGFIYLESSNKQPFFVLQGGQLFSSTPSGYLLMRSKERDTLDISIGFPRDRWNRKRFRVPVSRQDNYWQWLQVDTGSWALYDKRAGKWMQEAVLGVAKEGESGSDSLSTEGFALWLEGDRDKPKDEKKIIVTEAERGSRGVELDFGWLMYYEDSGDTVWVWMPQDERKILKQGLKEEIEWREWYDEAMRERAWEAELRQQANPGEKRKKQGE
jgi:hypothetical protein